MAGESRTPIVIGASSATVVRVESAAGYSWIEKSGPASEISAEAAVLTWCTGRLPVPQVIEHRGGVLRMTEIPGLNLTEVSLDDAVRVILEALTRIHTIPFEDCPFPGYWHLRLHEAERRMKAGLVDQAEFDEENLGRDPAQMFAELASLPALLDRVCFTHGDACLPNFLSEHGQLSGIVDWGRAGVTHPAQDWALALRSMRFNFGPQGERVLREHVPADSANESLLRRFRLLDEFF